MCERCEGDVWGRWVRDVSHSSLTISHPHIISHLSPISLSHTSLTHLPHKTKEIASTWMLFCSYNAVREMSERWEGDGWEMSERCEWEMSERCEWEMSERCEWEISERWVGDVVRDVKEISERWVRDVWEMWRRSVRDVKEMSERCEGDECEMWRRWVSDLATVCSLCHRMAKIALYINYSTWMLFCSYTTYLHVVLIHCLIHCNGSSTYVSISTIITQWTCLS